VRSLRPAPSSASARLQHHRRALDARGGPLEPLRQPRHGLGRLAAGHVQASERVEGLGARLEGDDAAVAGERALDVAEALLGELGELRPQADGAGLVADGLEALGVLAEEFGEVGGAGLGGEDFGEGGERGVVAGLLLEVAAEDVDPSAALLDDADDAGDVEAQLELALGVRGARELVVAQGEELGEALLGREQGAEGADDLEVVGALIDDAAVERDRLAALAELAEDRGGAQAHGLRGLGGEGEGRHAAEQVGGLAALAGLVVEATELLRRPRRRSPRRCGCREPRGRGSTGPRRGP
jgi:hypothetical protein